MAIKPSAKGFKIDDSMFAEDNSKDFSVEMNPNLGFVDP